MSFIELTYNALYIMLTSGRYVFRNWQVLTMKRRVG